jgi:hypothetical protein
MNFSDLIDIYPKNSYIIAGDLIKIPSIDIFS